jgi:hypothetical protein
VLPPVQRGQVAAPCFGFKVSSQVRHNQLYRGNPAAAFLMRGAAIREPASKPHKVRPGKAPELQEAPFHMSVQNSAQTLLRHGFGEGRLTTRSRPPRRLWAIPSCRAYRRSVPVTTISTCRLPHGEHTSRSRQLGTAISAPYRCACSAGSGST